VRGDGLNKASPDPGDSFNPKDGFPKELLSFWRTQQRGGGGAYAITRETIAQNLRDALGHQADDPTIEAQIDELADAAFNGEAIRDAMADAKEMSSAWFASVGRLDLLALIGSVEVEFTLSDQPRAEAVYQASTVILDVGLHGAISRSSRFLTLLLDSPSISPGSPVDPGGRRHLTDERLLALWRLDASYWNVLRWHGLFATHFQFRNTADPRAEFAGLADHLALRFALLHELAHFVHRQDAVRLDPVSSEIEADVAATHIMRYSWGPALAALGASLYLYATRRIDAARFLVPPRTHPNWFQRQSEVELALGKHANHDVTEMLDRVYVLHDLADMRYISTFDPRPPIEHCFDLWSEVIGLPDAGVLERISVLEDLDLAFHSPPVVGYAIAGHHYHTTLGNALPALDTIPYAALIELAKPGRGLLRGWLQDHHQLLEMVGPITYRSLACESETMPTLLRGARARYAANRLGIDPPNAIW